MIFKVIGDVAVPEKGSYLGGVTDTMGQGLTTDQE